MLTVQEKTGREILALEIAIASSRPGGGVSSSSPSFNSPNFAIIKTDKRLKRIKDLIREGNQHFKFWMLELSQREKKKKKKKSCFTYALPFALGKYI